MAKYQEDQQSETLVAAVNCFDLLINHINLSRSEITSLKSKSNISARKSNVYQSAIDAMILAYEATNNKEFLKQAFIIADNSKSNNLNERLTLLQQKIGHNIPADWKRIESDLLTKINLKEKEIFETKKSGENQKLATLQNELFYLKQSYDSHFAKIKDQFPYYTQTRQNKSVDILKLSEDLGEKEALLSFFLTDSSLYLFVLAQDLELIKIENIDTLKKQFTSLIHSLKNNAFDRETSIAISTSLLQPAVADLKAKGITSLLIIPDGYLNYLPFEILPSEINSPADDPFPYLIKDFTIHYHYAANLINVFKDMDIQRKYGTDYYGFAPTFDQHSNPLIATRSARNMDISTALQDLPRARQEVLFTANLMNGKSFTSTEATEQNFKQAGKKAGIIHLASHAIIDDEDPMYSKIVFAQEGDETEDGLLYTYELYNMELNAQLACLSACNTGFGNIQSGEGVVSLARGFMYAGVPNVMMSLWSVPDAATAEIMKTFYEELKKGKGKADALRVAKLSYLQQADANTSTPYYWAALTMIGDNEPIKSENQAGEIWLWVLCFVILAGLTGLFIIQSKKNTIAT